MGDLPRQAPRPARPIAIEPFLGARVRVEQAAGLATQPAQDPGAVVEQATVGGIMNVRFDDGSIRPQLLAGGHPLRHGEMHEAIIQAV